MLKNNIPTDIRRIPYEMLDKVIPNFNVQVATTHNHSAPKSLDRALYKLWSCACRMVVYEEKTYMSVRPAYENNFKE